MFPGTGYEEEKGIGKGEGYTLNIPMMPGSNDEEYKYAFEKYFLPKAEDFSPEFVLISAGFDAHKNDHVGNMQLETHSYQWLTEKTLELNPKRTVSILEGGYNLQALGECAATHLKFLL